jgi:hypothetical protein
MSEENTKKIVERLQALMRPKKTGNALPLHETKAGSIPPTKVVAEMPPVKTPKVETPKTNTQNK